MEWTSVPQAALRAVLLPLGLCVAISMPVAHAGPTDLADIPLANSSTVSILPNIMLDLDNSGSMSWTYMPDFVRYQSDGTRFSKVCRGPSGLVTCETGDPAPSASAFNSLYYNPEIRYSWPVNADGTRLKDWTGATSYGDPWQVPSDGYGIQAIEDSSTAPAAAESCLPAIFTPPWPDGNFYCHAMDPKEKTNLVTGYPERVWCKKSTDLPGSANCVSALDAQNNYAFPNATYQYAVVRKGAPYYYNVKVQWCDKQDGNAPYFGTGNCQDKRIGTYQFVNYSGWSRVNITSTTSFPAKAKGRTDCVGSTCTYAEEMLNFATWYAWYRTRAQMTKSAIGLSFRDVRGTPIDGDLTDANYLHARIGLTTINDPITLNIDNFDNKANSGGINQKASFFSNLYGFNPSGGTPLRKSLNMIGQMYKGESSVYNDPLQFSCQKNYVILATDGYWNDTELNEVKSGKPFDFTFPDQANRDQDKAGPWPSKDDKGALSTLADVAYYYYNTDLRTTKCSPKPGMELCANNVTSSGSNANVDDVAQHQHMTTFTIGLGVDGTLKYDPNYKTSTSGDYYKLTQGSISWPKPVANKQETIDDLWHAAVNGRGTYFSARNPAALESGLRKALSSIDSTNGSGAAAATSNLLPTNGDMSIYIATYRTLKWDAEVSAYNINLSTGEIIAPAKWQAEPLMRAKITTDGLDDSRTIYTASYDKTGALVRTMFSAAKTGGLTPAQLAMFDPNKLSQAAGWAPEQKAVATPETLVNYLRGRDHYEDQARPDGYVYQRLYRDRDKILGDIVHAQPIYVQKTRNTFSEATDPGFQKFAAGAAGENRPATLYVAANDGMLHAFDATSEAKIAAGQANTIGQERWAFIPPMLLPKMYRLADVNYESKHRYYLDGPLTINDAVVGKDWATVLIGAMGKGGRGYYALDVTDPTNPKVLWDFTADKNPNLGYTYGTPLITKRKDGKWVAVLASGYNNIPEDDGNGGTNYSGADGKGYVFVLDLADGHVLNTIATGVGEVANPSGLAWINARVNQFETENAETIVYGGDLTGTMWRMNIDTGEVTHLIDLGAKKPIMAAPEIGEIDHDQYGNLLPPSARTHTVYFGTGRYLGKGDLDDTENTQTLYGIKDDQLGGTVKESDLNVATASGTGPSRAVQAEGVTWSKSGWRLDLIDKGERVSVNPQLYFGTVVFSTTVPSISECQPGGYSWLYQLNAETGGAIDKKPGALKYNSPVVGVTVTQLPNGKPIIHAVTADGKKPSPTDLNIGVPLPNPKRILYRELTN